MVWRSILDHETTEWARQKLEPPWWQDSAACQGADPDIFFPDRGGKASKAKKLCSSCPVASPCLDFALENDLAEGIWGNMTPKERRAIRRERRLRRIA